jgi:hypothetical protein
VFAGAGAGAGAGASPFFIDEGTGQHHIQGLGGARRKNGGKVKPTGERWTRGGGGGGSSGSELFAGGELRHAASAGALVPRHLADDDDGGEGGDDEEEEEAVDMFAPRGDRGEEYSQSLRRAQTEQALAERARAHVASFDALAAVASSQDPSDEDGGLEVHARGDYEDGGDEQRGLAALERSASKRKVGPFRRGQGDPVKEAQRRRRAERAATWNKAEVVPGGAAAVAGVAGSAAAGDSRPHDSASLSPASKHAVSFGTGGPEHAGDSKAV